ncbi:MAG TPA: prolyl oligopeptidase family serine peptidase [Chthoniobacteraceae bacterium]|jgi:dienelactone hydrolase|nr:prolyl oligopeptidase family serine peptidase [Chthoniobacteraceae bacterium]
MSLSRLSSILLLTLALSPAFAYAQAAPVPPATKRVPPKGVEIPAEERTKLEAGVQELAAELKKIPADAPLRPDVEIFLKAVDWALRYDEFFNPKQTGNAQKLLAEGLARARALQAGESPWTAATGNIVRGFRSKIDGSAQPYGIVVPATWQAGDKKPRALYVFNHGRGDTNSELAFISGRMGSAGEFTPADTFVVHPYGRFCNATKFAGETDVFESIAHASSAYPIDQRRIVMTGFSMGGASVWHLGAHYAWMWAAASPGAGFSETQVYTKAFAEGKEPPPWWEQTLWHLYNATDYVANLQNTAMIAYSGEIDPQKQSADIMEKAATDTGFKLERIIGPNTGHKYEPEAKKELDRRLEEHAAKGRPANPAKVTLVTYTLKYNRQAWVNVNELEEHWKRAEVKAEITDGGTIKATTSNVASLSFSFPQLPPPFKTGQPVHVLLDGQDVTATISRDGEPWTPLFRKIAGHWSAVIPIKPLAPVLRKSHGLQGPIDDAFTDSFIYVRPTGKSLNDVVGAWVKAEMERAIPQWRTVFRGDARVVDDTAVTEEMIANANLVLWGDPASNKVLARIIGQLPIKWSAESVEAHGVKYPAGSHVPILIYPNPLNPKKYVVINSSFTFRQGADTTNALQTPKLPDWAVVDLRTPPSAQWPGLVVDAGFFDEAWQWRK